MFVGKLIKQQLGCLHMGAHRVHMSSVCTLKHLFNTHPNYFHIHLHTSVITAAFCLGKDTLGSQTPILKILRVGMANLEKGRYISSNKISDMQSVLFHQPNSFQIHCKTDMSRAA